jgi:hypothetical protein
VDSSAIITTPGTRPVAGGVELLQEADRLEVFPPPAGVGCPLARLARVVQVEHRRDGVDAQTVDVELLEPVQRVRHQEVAHLGAPVVEDVGPPLRVLAAARVRVLVQRCPVEAGERPVVLGKVCGHPVQQHADTRLVHPVDEQAQPVGVAVAGGGARSTT